MLQSSTTTSWVLALLAVACLGLGCSTMPCVMSPKVGAALRAGELGFQIEKIQASKHSTRDWGAGLHVIVWVNRNPANYSRDLELELNGAAAVLAALAKSPLSVKWDFVSVLFNNDYGRMPPEGRRVAGAAHVLITREAILKLRAQGALAADYAQNWRLVLGVKDQPDSKVLMEWKETPKS